MAVSLKAGAAKALHHGIIPAHTFAAPGIDAGRHDCWLDHDRPYQWSLFAELIYNIPGFGLLTIEGIRKVDYPIIMAVAVVGTLIIFVSNFLVDMIYPILDPRVRVQ